MALIFLSYCREADAALAHLLESELTNRGHTAFLDVKILPGGRFLEPLELILESATSVVVILSDAAAQANSEYQAMEVETALRRNKRVVPVVPPGFDWQSAGAKAPWIVKIHESNAVVISYDYRDAFIDRLLRFAVPQQSPPRLPPRLPRRLANLVVEHVETKGGLRLRLRPRPWWKFW